MKPVYLIGLFALLLTACNQEGSDGKDPGLLTDPTNNFPNSGPSHGPSDAVPGVEPGEHQSNGPRDEWTCRRDSAGNYRLTRLADMLTVDQSFGDQESCETRVPNQGDLFVCRRNYMGDFLLVSRDTWSSMDRQADPELNICLRRVPTGKQRYYCRQDVLGTFYVASVSDGVALDGSVRTLPGCLEQLTQLDH